MLTACPAASRAPQRALKVREGRDCHNFAHPRGLSCEWMSLTTVPGLRRCEPAVAKHARRFQEIPTADRHASSGVSRGERRLRRAATRPAICTTCIRSLWLKCWCRRTPLCCTAAAAIDTRMPSRMYMRWPRDAVRSPGDDEQQQDDERRPVVVDHETELVVAEHPPDIDRELEAAAAMSQGRARPRECGGERRVSRKKLATPMLIVVTFQHSAEPSATQVCRNPW